MENSEKKRSSKNQKILIQTGVVIIILFTFMTIAVGNMITMASFSTALNSNMEIFEYIMDTLGDNLNEYKSLSWLMDYWKTNAASMVTDDGKTKTVDNIDDILEKLSVDRGADILSEDADSLTPKEQLNFAIFAYGQFSEVMSYYQDEEEDYAIVIAMEGEGDTEPVAIISNYPGEEAFVGRTANLKELEKVIVNTSKATKAKVWQWAFTTPGDNMMFGTKIPFKPYTGENQAEYYGIFTGSLVYEDMDYTSTIRNSVIIMMVVVFILILAFLYFIVPRPLARLKKCVVDYSESKDTDKLTKELSQIHSRNEIGAFADQFSDMAVEMERYTKEMEKLAADKERVETELNVAQNIQMSMLPHMFPENSSFKLSASMTPAKEVGGDKLESVLSTVLTEDTPQDVMKKVRNAVDVFAGAAPQYDDLTMLCLFMSKKSRTADYK